MNPAKLSDSMKIVLDVPPDMPLSEWEVDLVSLTRLGLLSMWHPMNNGSYLVEVEGEAMLALSALGLPSI
jgi:hypothetical protein